MINLGALSTTWCSFVNISYFGLNFLQYILYCKYSIYSTVSIYYTFKKCKKIDFLKPEHETTCLKKMRLQRLHIVYSPSESGLIPVNCANYFQDRACVIWSKFALRLQDYASAPLASLTLRFWHMRGNEKKSS